MTEQKRTNLLRLGLTGIPEDPDRARLLQALPLLDPLTSNLMSRWLDADADQKQALNFVLTKIEQKDANFARLLSGYYLNNAELMHVLLQLPRMCSFVEKRFCQ